MKLVIIIDYGFAFVLFYDHHICTKTRLQKTKTSPKESSNTPDKIKSAVARDSSKISAFVPQDTRLGCVLTNEMKPLAIIKLLDGLKVTYKGL